MPLWKTRLRVVVEHCHPDDEYTVTYEGVLGFMSWGPGHFSVCIGGKGTAGEGQTVSVQPRQMSATTVTVYEI